jgi:hypothetical protein
MVEEWKILNEFPVTISSFELLLNKNKMID